MYIFETSFFGIHIAPTWYWLMYAFGFSFCYFFVGRYGPIQKKHMDTLLLYIFFGVILWGRIGYVVLYNPEFFYNNPSEIFAIWNGGMSFHGGFLWVLLACYVFGLRYNYRFFQITDILAVCLPVALWLGRIGNYINSELPGYAGYTWPFAMTLWDVSYFPSPLLQAFLEGIVLTSLMFLAWKMLDKKRLWILSAIFLIGYGCMRLIAEEFRLPDAHIGYLFSTSWLTIGMLYTLPMILVGTYIIYTKKETTK